MQLKNPPQIGAGIAFKVKEKKHEKAPDWDAVLVLDDQDRGMEPARPERHVPEPQDRQF